MTANNVAFSGSIPTIYHEHLGPMLFKPYARDLARRVPVSSKVRLLELACGTGILTAELDAALPADVTIVATDLNEPMIQVARTHVHYGRVQWRTADAMSLPFDAASFDVVACQFGVMFFPDKIQAAREVRRVLRSGGVYLFNVWGTLAENPTSRIANETINGFFASDPPTFYQVPFGYADERRIAGDLTAAGFGAHTIETVDLTGSTSPESAAVGLTQGNPSVTAIRERAAASLDDVTGAVAAALAREFGAGEIRIPMRAHVVTACS